MSISKTIFQNDDIQIEEYSDFTKPGNVCFSIFKKVSPEDGVLKEVCHIRIPIPVQVRLEDFETIFNSLNDSK